MPAPWYWRDGCSDARARHQGRRRQAQGRPRRARRGGGCDRPLESPTDNRPRHAVVAYDLGRASRWNSWLDVFCPGCGTSRAIDLRTMDRHPLASVGTLVLGLRRSW
jgi:hypothetical protein